MNENVSQQPKPERSKLWIGCLVIGLIGIVALAALAGGAYYFGFFDSGETPIVSTPIEQIATETVQVLATVPPATEELAQATPTLVIPPPEVEIYDRNLNVQYPSLATLADESGNVTILPGQPTILDIRWCASGESTLSTMTNLLDLTVLINDVDVPPSSFNLSQIQTTLQINEEKESALCNVLTGLVRNWGSGDYTVKLSYRATAAYNDGWKDHPADEVQEFTYNVQVTPSSSSVEWDRCKVFEDLKPKVVFLDPQPNEPHGLYFQFANGVPGLETEVAGDIDDWEYTATIQDASSDKPCTFQQGYDGRLYCKVQIISDYVRSVRPVSLSVNGCNWPVYLTNAEIP